MDRYMFRVVERDLNLGQICLWRASFEKEENILRALKLFVYFTKKRIIILFREFLRIIYYYILSTLMIWKNVYIVQIKLIVIIKRNVCVCVCLCVQDANI